MDFMYDEIIVRPELHAPEIDPYNKISLSQIIWKN